MAVAEDQNERIEQFQEFYRTYYSDEIGELAEGYPGDRRSLYINWNDLLQFDSELADKLLEQPEQVLEHAEEALRLYDLPIDMKLGQAHVRPYSLPDSTAIRKIRSHHVNTLVSVQGIVRKATSVRPKVTEAAFECQRCKTLIRIPQGGAEFQEPHECQGCERQGPFEVNVDQSEFVDAQRLRVQESPEGLRGGETPEALDVSIEDDVTGEVSPGDRVAVTGVLRLDQSDNGDQSAIFDVYMDGVSVEIEDEEFEEMNISEDDKKEIIELSNESDIYEQMIASTAPTIYGYEQEKLSIILQLFSGVTKHLPDGSRIRGDLHMLLIGDPGTGKCVHGDTKITLGTGAEKPIRELVESNLDDPTPVDDGVYDDIEQDVVSLRDDGTSEIRTATRVWKREAPETMYRVRTASGYELEATPSHPLFVATEHGVEAVQAEELAEGTPIATFGRADEISAERANALATDGGLQTATTDRIESIEPVKPEYDWVYDLEVDGTHSYVSNGVFSHNSQLLQYVREIAPRSVYTSGKGSSAAGLTAAAVRDDFGDGQQWTLEAGALVLADKGIAAVDELDKMRCITGDSLVHLGEGGVTRIRDLAHRASETGTIEELPNGRTIRDVEFEAWTMTDDGRLVTRPITAIHEYDAPEELADLTLRTGERITTTQDHPFFVFEDGKRVEKPAAELQADDWVYVPRQIPESATDGGVAMEPSNDHDSSDQVDPAMAAVLGYLAGDGNLYYNRDAGVYGIRFINAEEELLTDFERTCREAFGAETVRPPSEQRSNGVSTVRLPGRAYADAVIDAGMNLERYDGKTLPAAVTRSTQAAKAAFVRALADSEGSVGDRNVKVFSSSYELLLSTKHLLLEFGITSQIQLRPNEDGRDVYLLAITDAESLRAYNRHIGFTLSRKQQALDSVCDAVDGSRTILDVIPDCGSLLFELRSSLRLYQSECGLHDATYCNFENGDANVSIRKSRTILEAFESRKREAREDLDTLADADWERIQQLTTRYHVTQAEIAEGTKYSQQQISRGWENNEALKPVVCAHLRTLLEEIVETDLDPLRQLVYGDVKWRRVETVETTRRSVDDDQLPLLRHELAELLECPTTRAVETANELLESDPNIDSWDALRHELDRYGIAYRTLADELDVADSTISRWVNGVVSTDRFDDARTATRDLIEEIRSEAREILSRIEARREGSVYDLTVAGTHNFVANGMIVHNSEDRSAMHEALEQQSISVSKAGINATLKSRCSLLGAANPKYGRFDQYEPIGEQIDLEPALISRFDLIFTVTDQPDEEEDRRLAQHIINTNYAGELETQQTNLANPDHSQAQVEKHLDEVEPEIDPELFRKYVAFAKRTCYPTMTEAARQSIEDFYVDLRLKGADEDAAVPVTARKLEALVRLAEASARVRLSDTVEKRDADRVIGIVESSLQDIGVDPETGELDADIVETGTSKSQRDRIQSIKEVISEIEEEYQEGAPLDVVLDRAEEVGIERTKAEREIESLRQKGEVYEPTTEHLRTT